MSRVAPAAIALLLAGCGTTEPEPAEVPSVALSVEPTVAQRAPLALSARAGYGVSRT